MKRNISLLLSSIFVSPAFLFSAMKHQPQNQQYTPQEQNAPQQEETCGESKRPMRVTARHIESNGIGYNQGYTTLEGFFSPITPWGDDEKWVPFVDLRGHAFNNGKFAANAGLGLRYICDYVYGINAYYDYRNTNHQHYNQFAAGLEALGKIWDFRINGYLPLGRRNSRYYRTSFDEFKKHSIFLSRKKEVSLKGANAEVGYHFDYFKDFPFYFAGGTYYLHGTGRTAWGGQLRAKIDFYDYLTLEGNVSYDHLFRWVGQGQVSVNYPFGARRQIKKSADRSCSNSMALSTRALQRVDRFEIIPVDHKSVQKKAIDPVTGDPYVVWFVDNTSHSQGTYESPFNTLVVAENNSNTNDIIYVFPGDGTDTGLNMGITLKNGQQLLGAGIDQQIATQFGSVNIPAQAYALPIISNTFANVTLNSVDLVYGNNVVSGFKLIDKLNEFVSFPPLVSSGALQISSGTDYLVKNNVLISKPDGNVLNFIGGGNATISRNTFISTGTDDTYGIACFGYPGGLPLEGSIVISDNLFTGANSSTGLAQAIHIDTFLTTGNVTVSILNNDFTSAFNSTPTFEDPICPILIFSGPAAGQTVTYNVIGNNIIFPNTPSSGVQDLAGFSLTAFGSGPTIVNVFDNIASTPSGVPGYLFSGTPANLELNFGSNNVGTRSGP